MTEHAPKSIVKLNWKGAEPGLDPFASLTGKADKQLVSFATCSAVTEEEIVQALRQLVERTALFARRLVKGARRALFLWDPVYVELTIVFTDESMYVDGPLVTRCRFTKLDELHSALSHTSEEKWDLETARFSQKMREWVATEVSRVKFPGEIDVYFSDQDRESFSPEEFEAARVSTAWRSF